MYYNGNDLDTTTKDELSGKIINKIVKQEIDTKVFDDIFGVFTSPAIETGMQIEEIEVANLSSTDFDKTGAKALEKADMDFRVLYHKINREKTFKATVSNKQIKKAMLNKTNMADLSNAIVNELSNSSAIEDYEAMKQLFIDIAKTQKKMVICDLNGNSNDMDDFTKAIQTIATNTTLPSTLYNFSGFKKEFNKKEDLVLVMDSALNARERVESLASAFNMDKKDLIKNMIILDQMPDISYNAEKADKGITIEIGKTADGVAKTITTYKANSGGSASVTGKAVCMLLNKRAIKRQIIERDVEDQHNSAGRFTNYFLHATDLLSYSTLKNAIVFVD